MDNVGMGLYNFVGILSVVLGIVKEVLIVFLLVRGIQITNIYLRKNKIQKVENVEENKYEPKQNIEED